MKFLYTVSLLTLFIFFSSCSKEEGYNDPLEHQFQITEIVYDSYTLEVYSEKPQLEVGYNPLLFRVKEQETNRYVDAYTVEFKPVMHMINNMHSCPISSELSVVDQQIKKGFAIFQMPSNSQEYWELSFDLTLNGQTWSSSKQLEVYLPSDGYKNSTVFLGADQKKYVLALVDPKTPKVAINEMSMKLYRMDTMMSFSVVEGGLITLDPRMPGMDNHSSPNNEDLVFNSNSGSYEGKLSLTMTGYWKLNLQFYDATSTLISGNPVTDAIDSSGLYLELEF